MRIVESEAQLLRASGPEADRPPARRERRWFLRPLPVAGLAAATLAVGVAGGVLLSGESTRTIQAQVAMTGAHATIRVTGDHAKLEVSACATRRAGHVYQCGSSAVRMRPSPPMRCSPCCTARARRRAGSVKGVNLILVTSEPSGGSVVPTSPPVITAVCSVLQVETCYRHPNRETGVHCSNCGPRDLPGLHDAHAVGMRCPECSRDKTRVRTLRSTTSEPVVTFVLIAVKRDPVPGRRAVRRGVGRTPAARSTASSRCSAPTWPTATTGGS